VVATPATIVRQSALRVAGSAIWNPEAAHRTRLAALEHRSPEQPPCDPRALLDRRSAAVEFRVGVLFGEDLAIEVRPLPLGNSRAGCYANGVTEPQVLEEAIQAIRRDPTHAVRVKLDEGLTVEVRAVDAGAPPRRTVGELLRDVGGWEGESGSALDALFTRQRGNRVVPELP
jgi:hypothetical protein